MGLDPPAKKEFREIISWGLGKSATASIREITAEKKTGLNRCKKESISTESELSYILAEGGENRIHKEQQSSGKSTRIRHSASLH